MAIYICSLCEEYKDDDYDPMDERGFCVDCAAEADEALREDLHDDIRKCVEVR